MNNQQRISSMRAGGRKLARILHQITQLVKPGVSLASLDSMAEKSMIAAGGEPGFKRVPGYNFATCINVNAGVVHGIPYSHIKLKTGDVVSLDMGLYFQGYHTDTSTTVIAGQATPEKQHFLSVGKNALKKAINQAKPGKRVGHISHSLQAVIEAAGFTCARTFTGHGVGTELHQFPTIPCFLAEDISRTPKIKVGMTLAIEIIYMQGHWQTKKEADNWTISTSDNRLAGLFEETILVTKSGPEILTK